MSIICHNIFDHFYKVILRDSIFDLMQRKHLHEHQRKLRIFDDRQRLIGVDKIALENQVKEKQQLDTLKKYQNEIMEQRILHLDKIAAFMEKQEAARIRLQNVQLNEFRLLCQTPDSRREFDINNPDKLKLEKPLRSNVEKDEAPVSGCQQFVGEDSMAKTREKSRQLEQRNWLDNQASELETLRQKDFESRCRYGSRMLSLDREARRCFQIEQVLKRQMAVYMSNTNLAMNEDQRCQREETKRREAVMNQMDIYTTHQSDLLSENPAVARSAYGAHRVVPDRWKGMSPEQISAIRRDQIRQIQEKHRQQEMEAEDENEWQQNFNRNLHLEKLKKDESARNRAAHLKQLQWENMQLSAQQKRFQNELERSYCSNTPSESFFSQFGTSSR